MPKYKISYTIDTYGEVIIEAKNQEEAEQKFSHYEWERKDDNEWTENTQLKDISLESLIKI